MRNNKKIKFNANDRKVFKNVPHEKQFNPWKVFYAYLYEGDKTFRLLYEGQSRTEARSYFEEQARLSGNTFDNKIYVL